MISVNKLFSDPLQPWMKGGGPEGDIILSSRVRLARNLEGVPFPNRNYGKELSSVVEKIRQVQPAFEAVGQHYDLIEMDELSQLEQSVLVEKHLISPNLVNNALHRAVFVRQDGAVSIMVNEEDHLRIQCLESGLDLKSALSSANKIDDLLEESLTFAFSEQLGYLTACPTNVGTGMRASCMLHLPALVITKQISRIISAATQLGLAVRGFYGEGTEAIGNVFQISNQLTLGYTEEEIVDSLNGVVLQFVEQERAARKLLIEQSKVAVADRIWRSYGVLRYAQTMSGQEALGRLSEVRLGIDLGIITGLAPEIYNELLVTTRPHYMANLAGTKDMDAVTRDTARAKIIREKLTYREQGGDE